MQQIPKNKREIFYHKKMDISNFQIEDRTDSFLEIPTLSKEEIAKTVENSQRIEGYEPTFKEVKERLKLLMEKHNVKVSL